MKWLQVSLELKGELVEPVSDLLHRHCEGGVIIEAAANAGLVLVRGYLPLTDDTSAIQRKIEEGLWHLP